MSSQSHGAVISVDGGFTSNSIVRIKTPASDAANAATAAAVNNKSDDAVGDVIRCWVRDASSRRRLQRPQDDDYDDVIKM